MPKPRLATAWLDGCSGCHMSFLDMDQRLIELAELAEIVYSPLVDIKLCPEGIDVALIEGAVSTEDDLNKVRLIRQRSRILVSFGDCAVTANVPSMRNAFEPQAVLDRAYLENATVDGQVPRGEIPHLLRRCRPVHEVVKVDVFIPGCPPSADTICHALTELLQGRIPDVRFRTRFGA